MATAHRMQGGPLLKGGCCGGACLPDHFSVSVQGLVRRSAYTSACADGKPSNLGCPCDRRHALRVGRHGLQGELTGATALRVGARITRDSADGACFQCGFAGMTVMWALGRQPFGVSDICRRQGGEGAMVSYCADRWADDAYNLAPCAWPEPPCCASHCTMSDGWA